MAASRLYKVRVEVTHAITYEGLQGLWKYHRHHEAFRLRDALTLYRQLMSDNPEVEIQIAEGLARLEPGYDDD